jgi:nitrogen fixation protein NifZ
MLIRDDDGELHRPPTFRPGEKVVARIHVKNDGTYPGRDIGDRLVTKGDVGYVRDIGTFLQRYYIYAVDWVERGTLVGMRGRELVRPADLKITSGEPA